MYLLEAKRHAEREAAEERYKQRRQERRKEEEDKERRRVSPYCCFTTACIFSFYRCSAW
jgi:hypothetical protein